MNYHKIYANLVSRGKERVMNSYKEQHHIIPRCMGGSDSSENLVYLTPEEHYLAHQLLVKIHNNNHALVKAAVMMICNRPSNKLYGWLRRKHSLAMSACQLGAGNSQYGTRWINNKTLRMCKKIRIDEDLPMGWATGRIVNFDAYFKQQELKKSKREKLETPSSNEQILKKIKTKHISFRRTAGYRRAKSIRLYREFKISNLSLREFAKTKKMVPMTLSKWFNEFIIEYNIVARISASKQL